MSLNIKLHLSLICLTLLTLLTFTLLPPSSSPNPLPSHQPTCAHRSLEENENEEEEEGGGGGDGPYQPTCADMNTCALCDARSECEWREDYCEDYDENAVWEPEYYQWEAFDFCESAVEDGQIDLDKVTGETIEMKPKSGTRATDIPVCEWDVIMDPTKTVKILLDRNVKVYEAIYISYQLSSNDTKEYYNKDLHTCSDAGFSIELEANVTQVFVRARAYNDLTNYNILMSQEGVDLSYPAVFTRNKALVRLVSYLLVILFTTLVVTIVTFAFCKNNLCFKTSTQKYNELLQRIDAKNMVQINKVMGNMVSGEYSNLNMTFVEKHCIICFEEFSPKHDVHLLNECLHLFHSGCLAKWFLMISRTRKLACPMCDNRPKEKSFKQVQYSSQQEKESAVHVSFSSARRKEMPVEYNYQTKTIEEDTVKTIF